jgi:RNA polymerase sigma factor (sigma-70 family)
VCEKLSEKKYRRLLAFHPDGRARFSTWLRAVVRNLCLDWLRSQFGRRQVFRSIASLGVLDQEIFDSVFRRGISIQNAWYDLSTKGFEISYAEFEERANRVRRLLTSRQLWLLSTSRTIMESLDSAPDAPTSFEVVDPSPDPEKAALLRDIHVAVSKAMQELHEGDRLLLRLRFLQGLSLLAIAELVGLKNAQTADRRIRDALQKLRENLGVPKPLAVKQNSVSV